MITQEEYYEYHESKIDLLRSHAEPPTSFKCEYCDEVYPLEMESEEKGVCKSCWEEGHEVDDDDVECDDSKQL